MEAEIEKPMAEGRWLQHKILPSSDHPTPIPKLHEASEKRGWKRCGIPVRDWRNSEWVLLGSSRRTRCTSGKSPSRGSAPYSSGHQWGLELTPSATHWDVGIGRSDASNGIWQSTWYRWLHDKFISFVLGLDQGRGYGNCGGVEEGQGGAQSFQCNISNPHPEGNRCCWPKKVPAHSSVQCNLLNNIQSNCESSSTSPPPDNIPRVRGVCGRKIDLRWNYPNSWINSLPEDLQDPRHDAQAGPVKGLWQTQLEIPG